MRIRSFSPLLAVVLAVTACDGSPTETTPTKTVFTYEYRIGSGTWSTFLASGRLPSEDFVSLVEGVEVTVGLALPRQHAFIEARQEVAPGSWIYMGGLVPLLSAGDVIRIIPINGTCPTGLYCVTAGFTLIPGGGAPAEACTFTDGSYVLTRVTDEWLSATFSGRGSCGRDAAVRSFEVRNGRLDVELSPWPAT